jgi:hypothetical protein
MLLSKGFNPLFYFRRFIMQFKKVLSVLLISILFLTNLGLSFASDASVLQSRIDNANSGETINIDGMISLNSPVIIDKNLTFTGSNSGVIVSSSHSSCLNIGKDCVVYFKDLSFNKFVIGINCGESSNIDFNNCVFDDCYTCVNSCNNCYITCSNCNFVNCNKTCFNLVNGLSHLSLLNSHFKNNSVNGRGSVIYSKGNQCIDINKCEFRNNYADQGGAVYLEDNVNLNVNDCQIIGNSAENQGGFLYSWGVNGLITISNSIIADNHIVNYDNPAPACGSGGFLFTQTKNGINTFNLISNSFHGNNAKHGKMVAMFGDGSHFVFNSNQYEFSGDPKYDGVVEIESHGGNILEKINENWS